MTLDRIIILSVLAVKLFLLATDIFTENIGNNINIYQMLYGSVYLEEMVTNNCVNNSVP